ncbi:MAG: hypothetical protein M5U28_01110 [Sandaracinaceae bacterium]|nr:hypothetical protein [Sandaracinaceae bacterium]
MMTREELYELLESTGWAVRGDTGPAEWRASFGWGIRALLVIEERLVVARAAAG